MPAPIYILGGSQTDFARNWAREQLEIYDLFAEALQAAISDAGIEPAQIEVGHVGNFVGDLFTRQGLLGGFLARCIPSSATYPRHAMKPPARRGRWRSLPPCAISRLVITTSPACLVLN
jgi:acetyl-CoA acetyltransferase